jgi:hypothetical protein
LRGMASERLCIPEHCKVVRKSSHGRLKSFGKLLGNLAIEKPE